MSKKNNNINQTSNPEAVGFKTRRTHKKSRYGCTKCKQRRIKVSPNFECKNVVDTFLMGNSATSVLRNVQDVKR